MANRQITYGELENGMRVWIHGHLFTVANITKNSTIQSGLGTATDSIAAKPENHTTVRFEGHCANAGDNVKGTVYDGGVYGGFSWVPAVIEDTLSV